MSPLAIFPCRFTDSARILGELSYTLSIPVYNDLMILTEMSEQLDMSIDKLKERLFGRAHRRRTTASALRRWDGYCRKNCQ